MKSGFQCLSSMPSSFGLGNSSACLKLSKVKPQNQNLTENRRSSQVFLHDKYLCFFGEEIRTLSNILAFDMNSSKWITIPIEAPSSQIFKPGSQRDIYSYYLGFVFHGSISNDPFVEIITLDYDPLSSSLKANWSNISINNLPFRKYHSSNILKNQLLVFGGISNNYQLCNNDLTVINLGN